MKEEFNLSEKIGNPYLHDLKIKTDMLKVKDVRKFIKKLKAIDTITIATEWADCPSRIWEELKKEINTLAGDDLK